MSLKNCVGKCACAGWEIGVVGMEGGEVYGGRGVSVVVEVGGGEVYGGSGVSVVWNEGCCLHLSGFVCVWGGG